MLPDLKHPEIQANYFDWICWKAIVFTELDAFGAFVINSKGGTGINLASVLAGSSYPKYYAFQVLFGLLGFAFNISRATRISDLSHRR